MYRKITYLLRPVLFVAILTAMLSIMSCFFFPKDNGAENGMHEPRANGFLAEKPDSLDAFVIGDSLVACAVSPLSIWDTYGITTYNCGTADQPLNQTLEYLQILFQNQSPKVVFLEVDPIYNADCPRADLILQQLERRLPVIRYHNLWKIPSELFGNVEYTHLYPTKGYRPFLRTRGVPDKILKKYMKWTDDYAAISKGNRKQLRKIDEFCRDVDTQLVLFSTPSVFSWNYRKHNGIADFADELGLTYIDMNVMQDAIPIDWKTETYDNGNHVNYSGARKVSDWLGCYLQDTGLFEDKRENPDYTTWNEAHRYFEDHLELLAE